MSQKWIINITLCNCCSVPWTGDMWNHKCLWNLVKSFITVDSSFTVFIHKCPEKCHPHQTSSLPCSRRTNILLHCSASAITDVLSQGQLLYKSELRVLFWCLGSLKEMEIPSHWGHKHSPLCWVHGHYQCFNMKSLISLLGRLIQGLRSEVQKSFWTLEE